MTQFDQKPIPAKAGIGLRSPHIQEVLQTKPDIGWLEVHAENFFCEGGAVIHYLEMVRAQYPLSLHGVGLSLGSADPLKENHLQQLKSLADRIQPGLISEHVSWSSIDGTFMNDLLPVPYTEESLAVLVQHINHTQEYLAREILVENPSSYLTFHESSIPEWEFMAELSKQSDCGILLDINNIYVSSVNHDFDAKVYIDAIPADRVGEIHLAGHSQQEVDGKVILIDTHSDHVIPAVWDLYRYALDKIGKKPTLIEWDIDIPPLSVLLQEAEKAQHEIEQIAYV